MNAASAPSQQVCTLLPPGEITLSSFVVGGEPALSLQTATYKSTFYKNGTTDATKGGSPAFWWGTEARLASDGVWWSRVLPNQVMDDFGFLVPVEHRL